MKQCLRYSRQRLRAALAELQEVRDQDYGYDDVYAALDRIESLLKEHVEHLTDQDPNPDPEVLAIECRSALAFIAKVLPILGLIVRSATVRNAFEIYGPIKHIAEILLSEIPPTDATGVKLVLSSGWDYMPFTFRPIEALTEFVFIVLPATESSNPLLVPIAGHELGHSVWARAGIWDQLQEEASSTLADYVHRNKTKFHQGQSPATLQKLVERRVEYPRLARQLEEFFCDFLGLYLFGESFLHAFTYFLSPNSPFDPSPNYPKVEIRVKKLLEACDQFRTRWGTEIYTKPTKLTLEFVETEARDSEETPPNPWQIAIDAVAEQLVPAVLKQIYILARKPSWASLRNFSRNKANEIRHNYFRWAVPASNTGSLANLMNAGWDVARDTGFWDRLPSLQNVGQTEAEVQHARDTVLHELLLKNIEVLEYEQKIQIPNAQAKRVTRSPKPKAKRVRR